MQTLTLSVLSTFCCLAPLHAQNFVYSPAGQENVDGGNNNSIPFWSSSGTYQQVHDAVDMTVSLQSMVGVFDALAFRRDGFTTASPAARTLDVEITMSETPVDAANATSTFATNHGPVLQLALPFTQVSLPALPMQSIPNPPNWLFPFQNVVIYDPAAGNLCWELRFRNGPVAGTGALDAASATGTLPLDNLGTGCAATGSSLPAAITARSLSMTTGAWRNQLDRAAPSAAAVMWVAFDAVQIAFPPLCSALEIVPFVSIAGSTDASGTWDSRQTLGSLVGFPPITLRAQFGFIDLGLPLGVGLSDASQIALPQTGANHIRRIYDAPFNGGPGFEMSTSGSISSGPYGLVTIFRTL